MEEMKMNGMVERVARAILKSRFFDCEPDAYGGDLEAFYRNLDPDHVIGAHFEARAALEAMREPTEAVIAGIVNSPGYEGTAAHARQDWHAAIDAALSEPQP